MKKKEIKTTIVAGMIAALAVGTMGSLEAKKTLAATANEAAVEVSETSPANGAKNVLASFTGSDADASFKDIFDMTLASVAGIDADHEAALSNYTLLRSVFKNDICAKADAVKGDYSAALTKIGQYSAVITDDGEGTIDTATYRAYKRILADPACSVTALEKDFTSAASYGKNECATACRTIGEKITSGDKSGSDWTASLDYADAAGFIRGEIGLLESRLDADRAVILTLNSMAYQVREYELACGIDEIEENEQPYAIYDAVEANVSGTFAATKKSLDSASSKYAANTKNSLVKAVVTLDKALDGRDVKGFASFDEAWKQAVSTGIGFTIKNTADCEITCGTCNVPSGMSITADLNGGTINAKKDVFSLEGNASLTVKNGTINGTENVTAFHVPEGLAKVKLTLSKVNVKDATHSVELGNKVTASEVNVIDCVLTYNKSNAILVGAGCTDTALTVEGGAVRYCKDSGIRVGALIASGELLPSFSRLIVKNCEFTGNTTTNNGGAIYSGARENTFENCTMIANKAAKGAGIYSVYGLNMKKCKLSSNKASAQGGAVYAKNSVVIDGCKFLNNTAKAKAQAICLESCKNKTTITGCIFATKDEEKIVNK